MRKEFYIIVSFIFVIFYSCSDKFRAKRFVHQNEKAAKKGNVIAMSQLSFEYSNEHSGIAIDTQKANYWTKKCAELNEPYCLYKAGHIATEFNTKKTYFLKAGDYGNPQGYWMVALLYHNKQYNQINVDSAIKYYNKASQGGLSYATSSLAYIYYYGEGVPKDTIKGLSFFLDAGLKAEEPDLSALTELIEYYRKSKIPSDSILLKALEKRKKDIGEIYGRRAK